MGGMVPLGDASRRPARVPVVTAGIIVVNVVVFEKSFSNPCLRLVTLRQLPC